MFKFFRKAEKKAPERLYFKDNEAAFEYIVKFIPGQLGGRSLIYGIVRSKNTKQSLKDFAGGYYTCDLATENGIVRARNCGTIHEKFSGKYDFDDSPLEPGDLVSIDVSTYSPNVDIDDKYNYFIVVAKLKPELKVQENVFPVKKKQES
jgi:hypothetical protein